MGQLRVGGEFPTQGRPQIWKAPPASVSKNHAVTVLKTNRKPCF